MRRNRLGIIIIDDKRGRYVPNSIDINTCILRYTFYSRRDNKFNIIGIHLIKKKYK